MIPSMDSLNRERAILASTIEAERVAGVEWPDSTATVADPVMTPFVRAVKAEGYTPKMNKGGCAALEQCPTCRSSSVWTFSKDGQDLKLCAWCGGNRK